MQRTCRFSVFNFIPDFTAIEKKKKKIYLKFTGNDNDWDIYEACALSLKAQREINGGEGTVKTLTYGEINFESVARIINVIKYQFGGLNRGMYPTRTSYNQSPLSRLM